MKIMTIFYKQIQCEYRILLKFLDCICLLNSPLLLPIKGHRFCLAPVHEVNGMEAGKRFIQRLRVIVQKSDEKIDVDTPKSFARFFPDFMCDNKWTMTKIFVLWIKYFIISDQILQLLCEDVYFAFGTGANNKHATSVNILKLQLLPTYRTSHLTCAIYQLRRNYNCLRWNSIITDDLEREIRQEVINDISRLCCTNGVPESVTSHGCQSHCLPHLHFYTWWFSKLNINL